MLQTQPVQHIIDGVITASNELNLKQLKNNPQFVAPLSNICKKKR